MLFRSCSVKWDSGKEEVCLFTGEHGLFSLQKAGASSPAVSSAKGPAGASPLLAGTAPLSTGMTASVQSRGVPAMSLASGAAPPAGSLPLASEIVESPWRTNPDDVARRIFQGPHTHTPAAARTLACPRARANQQAPQQAGRRAAARPACHAS